VLGPSGSGKSTLLRCINHLESWDDGTVHVSGRRLGFGEDGRSVSPRTLANQRASIGVGMVFQQFNLVKRSSVITNVLAGRLGYLPSYMSLFNYFPPSDHQAALKTLARLGLEDKAYDRADSLSGGQQQRVGIARALMQDPKLILADEPVSALDPVLSHSILKYLEACNKEDGITVLCSLHFLDLVHRYATSAIGLKDGQLVFQGLPKDIDDAEFKVIFGQEAEHVGIV